ncbi:MAG: hypothetical protein DHS20C21_05250 [Gemmatimonadota bacterium]|nr:MAG: hypothetical protein DHS20C21_05250 [Gemmatimonadota bacterium]
MCATNLTLGVNWEFSRDRIGDYRSGYLTDAESWQQADAIVASACFPPVFGPMRVDRHPSSYSGGKYQGGDRDQLLRRIHLSDGGLYDNLALEPVWKTHRTIIVSDAGAPFPFWEGGGGVLGRMKRYASVLSRQSQSVRKRLLFHLAASGQAQVVYIPLAGVLGTFSPESPHAVLGSRRVIARLHRFRTDLDGLLPCEASLLEAYGYLMASERLRVASFTMPEQRTVSVPLVEEEAFRCLDGSSHRLSFRRFAKQLAERGTK